MPKSDGPPGEAPHSLQSRLDAFETERDRKSSPAAQLAMAQGYRFLGEVVGGVLGGAGFGWVFDRFAHTGPWGVIGGLLIGTALALFAVARNAAKTSKTASELAGPLPSVPDDDDED